MINASKNLYNEYEKLLISNEKLNAENRDIKYKNMLLLKQIETLENSDKNKDKEIKNQKEKIDELSREVERLRCLLGLNGTNSGIPTSQTPINKKKVIPNTREKTDLKRGGQEGHRKHKLNAFSDDEVTEIVEHDMQKCPYCNSENIEKNDNVIQKDELDYKIVVEKKRHKFNEYECKECKKRFHQNIPNNLKEENQYGAQVQALILTLANQANVTMNKIKEIIYGLTDGQINVSEGYIAKLQKRGAKRLEEFKEELRKEMIVQPLLHWDDTVIMINTARGCLRFYGNEKLALYKAHEHKDKEGIDEDKILKLLPKETIVVHDHNKVNYNEDYGFTNAECNRHLIADLKKVSDNLGHEWSSQLAQLLSGTNEKRKKLIKEGKEEFTEKELKEFNNEFDKIMLKAYEENEKDIKHYYSKKEKTLIRRILDYKNEYLLWLYDFNVPFTNNLSERGVRGAKSKMKAAGQFINIKSASWYADIKSYIETCKRNGENIYNALIMLSVGKPYTLKDILNQNVKS